MKGVIKMPYQVDPYESYIHDEFKNIAVRDNSMHQQKYDKLFGFFNSLKIEKGNLDFASCYSFPEVRNFLKSNKKSLNKSKKKK